MKKNGKSWVEIRERKTKELVRIVYNPYKEKTKEVVRAFIPEENLKFVYGIRTQ
jgi:hypothetical protein